MEHGFVHTMRWLADAVGVAVPPPPRLPTGPFSEYHARCLSLDAVPRPTWLAMHERQRPGFHAAAAMLRRAADGDAEGADAAAARLGEAQGGENVMWQLLAVAADENGRRLECLARAFGPAAVEWVAGWRERMLLAWAMAGHGRLARGAAAGRLGDDVVRGVGLLILRICPVGAG
jgi:hypothetical protein